MKNLEACFIIDEETGYDPLAEARHEKIWKLWAYDFFRASPCELAVDLARKHCPGMLDPKLKTTAAALKAGAFNICYTVCVQEKARYIVRFAMLGASIHRREKLRKEANVIQFLRQCTPIPVPQLHGIGVAQSDTLPYMVMGFIEGEHMYKRLSVTWADGRARLDPCISDRRLKNAYRELSRLLIHLSTPAFPRIGALERVGEHFEVSGRPLTFNMNQLAKNANLPPHVFPDRNQTFSTAREYFLCLADMHLSKLKYQRNNSFRNENHCRKKYIARGLFKKIILQLPFEDNEGPFRLYCDDFRPSNVLVHEEEDASSDDFRVSAVIDWEFAYAAPAQFTYVAPWWLLIENVEAWVAELEEFLASYIPRLRTFLEVMRECESDMQVKQHLHLSDRMEKSMENGLFWICLAARYSSMFDDIYWMFLDEKFFGKLTSMDDRLALLDREDRDGIDDFVRFKMDQVAAQTLDVHYTEDDLKSL